MERSGFVDVRSMDSTIRVSLMYARADNFTGRVLYTDLHEAYLHPKAARALAKAQKILKASHPELSLKVYDAARPMHIQQKMWNVVAGTPKNIYVSNPKNGGGLHNYGMAVDLTLCDVKGDTLPMGTKIDYLGKLAHIDNEAEMVKLGKLTPEARRNRELLRDRGYNPSFVIYDRSDSLTAVKHVMQELNVDTEKFAPSWALNKISEIKSSADPASVQFTAYDNFMGDVYEKYSQALREQGAFDFDDLIAVPLALLKSDAELLARERERLQWVLVDEYQDVNGSQYQMMRLLVGGSNNLMVVGDPDQSIYGWRGANYATIMNFERDFPNAKVTLLERNYRSTAMILDASNQLIRHNKNRREKNLRTDREEGQKVSVWYLRDEKAEAEALAREIVYAQIGTGMEAGDFDPRPYELDAHSVCYALCRRYGVPVEQPDFSGVVQQYGELEAPERLNMLRETCDLSKVLNRGIERALDLRQRSKAKNAVLTR